MPSNEQMAARCQFLLQAIQLIQSNVKEINEKFKLQAESASQAIDDALQKAGLHSTEDLVKKVTAECSEEDAKLFNALIEKNRLPTSWDAIIGKDTADRIRKIGDLIGSLSVMYGLGKIKPGFTFDMKVSFEYLATATRASALRVAADRVAAAQVQKAMQTAIIEDEIELAQLEGREVTAALQTELEALIDQQIELSAESATVDYAVIQAAKQAATAEAELLTARAAARSAMTRGLWGLVAGVVILGGVYAYGKYNESKEADRLKEAIGKLATGRLYALASQKEAVNIESLAIYTRMIAAQYGASKGANAAGGDEQWKQTLEMMIGDLKKFNKIDFDELEKELQAQDKGAGQDTSVDPKDWHDMEKIHLEEMKKKK